MRSPNRPPVAPDARPEPACTDAKPFAHPALEAGHRALPATARHWPPHATDDCAPNLLEARKKPGVYDRQSRPAAREAVRANRSSFLKDSGPNTKNRLHFANLTAINDIARMVKRQTSFFDKSSEFSANRIAYGGDTRGRRKSFRPVDRKRPLHLVMKASGANMLAKKLKVREIVESKAAKYGLKIHGFQNVGNHLHLMVSFKHRKDLQTFLRVAAGLIARTMTGAEKGRKLAKRFWDHIVYSRIVTGRKDFAKMQKYLTKNEIERELGTSFRQAMELHEEAAREAKLKKISMTEVLERWLAKAAAANDPT